MRREPVFARAAPITPVRSTAGAAERAVFGTLDELRAHREKKHAGVFDPHFDDVAVLDSRGDGPPRARSSIGKRD